MSPDSQKQSAEGLEIKTFVSIHIDILTAKYIDMKIYKYQGIFILIQDIQNRDWIMQPDQILQSAGLICWYIDIRIYKYISIKISLYPDGI